MRADKCQKQAKEDEDFLWKNIDEKNPDRQWHTAGTKKVRKKELCYTQGD